MNFIASSYDQFQASKAAIAVSGAPDNPHSLLFRNAVAGIYAPRSMKMRVTAFATYTGNDVAAWGKLRWDFYVNGVLHEIYNSMFDQVGLQNSPMTLGVPIVVMPGGLLEVRITNSDAVTHSGGIILKVEYGR